jgi:hypothetical protein
VNVYVGYRCTSDDKLALRKGLYNQTNTVHTVIDRDIPLIKVSLHCSSSIPDELVES